MFEVEEEEEIVQPVRNPSLILKDEQDLESYNYKDDPDNEIEFLAARRLSHEKDIHFSKNGVIQFIESMLEEEL